VPITNRVAAVTASRHKRRTPSRRARRSVGFTG
jgi:hypothetical protein